MKCKNDIQKSIDQIGEDAVIRYLPKGMKLCSCDIHGKFLCHYSDSNPICPLCANVTNEGNGQDATSTELAINLRDLAQTVENYMPPDMKEHIEHERREHMEHECMEHRMGHEHHHML